MSDDGAFILGEDGKVHMGEANERMSGWQCVIDCGVLAMRPMYPTETWWQDDDHRICPNCMREVGDD